ncbi:CFI-box-CTERM domain-containing protein [Bdellovibrio sp. HCB274]|uniref:CFI-box-CTERM domain-containing protein n=1 Tax=Bdellovibrio sp. HCB274 TaxID=3394361 RepID=UPI0039B3AA2A
MRLFKQVALFSTTLLMSKMALAALTFGTVGGATSVDSVTTPTKPIIYGGFAGTCGTTTTNTTCDTCTGNGLEPCNKNAVFPELILTLVLNTSTPITSTSDITLKIDSTTVNPTNIILGTTSVTITLPWSEICSKAINDSTCMADPLNHDLTITSATNSTGASAGTFTFHFISSVAPAAPSEYTDCPDDGTAVPANTGLCNFTAFPGDSKLYARGLAASDGYPTSTTGVNFKSAIFFYVKQTPGDSNATTVGQITNKSDSFEVPINVASMSKVYVSGLTNGENYCMVMANRDLVGNIYYFTPVASVSPDSLCGTPTPVAGLLDDKSCFIATAAFGSDMAPEVQSFRDFRNKYLLPYSWGREFVKTYYKYSPKYANMIAQNDTAKIAVRGVLWPLLFFARMSVAVGFWYALGFVLLAGLTLWGLYQRLILGRNVRGEL